MVINTIQLYCIGDNCYKKYVLFIVLKDRGVAGASRRLAPAPTISTENATISKEINQEVTLWMS
jgi:hypothetical protein